MKPSPTKSRAFTLIEMMMVLSLLTTFFLLSAKLFTSLFRQVRDTSAAQNDTASFDSALTQLRADIWSADSLQTDGPTLLITHASQTIAWSAITPTSFTRTDLASSRHWPLPANTHLSFSLPTPTLLDLHLNDDTLLIPNESSSLKGPPQ
ncbi:MAG TPA: prepilin-type N-terminal cleavage/methylation domain-containing protein [Tepidisphaeraceae bacterium]|jgi:prepilin-type N-terminal cleavage/methylation domain-containing protein|nr:prepilin-type N-terminal cleavage/methylation domain-containing protein [Tepidisphaeraceae bacterium]